MDALVPDDLYGVIESILPRELEEPKRRPRTSDRATPAGATQPPRTGMQRKDLQRSAARQAADI